MSDIFLAWTAAVLCVVAALDRPDRMTFWTVCAWVCIISVPASGLLAGAR